MEFPVEATLNMKPFQDQKEVRHLLRSHGFTLTDIGGDKVRISGNFMELKVVKIHLEQLMATNTHQYSSSPVKELASGFTSSMDSKETFPPDQQGSVRSREEAIIVVADVFKYAEQLRKRELDEALKGHVRMHQQDTGESVAITLSGKNSREAGSKLKHFLADLNKFLRTQDILLRDLNPKGVDLSKKIGKSGIIVGSNLVWLMGDRVHIIGPPKESFELKQELLVDQREHSGKPSEMDGRKRRNLSLQRRLRKNPKIDFQQVSTPGVDEASGFSSSHRVPADRHHSGKSSERDGRKKGSLAVCLPLEKKSRKDVREVSPPYGGQAVEFSSSHRGPADHRHSRSQRVRRSSTSHGRPKAEIFKEPEEEVALPKQRNKIIHRIRSIFKKSKRTK